MVELVIRFEVAKGFHPVAKRLLGLELNRGVAILVGLCLIGRAALGAELLVGGELGAYQKIGDALSDARTGDVVVVSSGRYEERIFSASHGVTVKGIGRVVITYQGNVVLVTHPGDSGPLRSRFRCIEITIPVD